MAPVVSPSTGNYSPINWDDENRDPDADTSATATATTSDSSSPDGPFKPSTAWRPTVEPIMFLQMLGLGIAAVSTQNFFLDRICMHTFPEFNTSVCTHLASNSSEESKIQRIYAQYSVYQVFIELGWPIVLSMFLAPWLDKYGSKLGLVLPLVGLSCAQAILLFFAFAGDSARFKPSLILIASVPISLSGGLLAFMLSAFTYIANITTQENRTMRIAIVEGCWFLGAPIGTLGGAQILQFGGYKAVFATSCGLYALAFLYSVFFLKNDKSGPAVIDRPATIWLRVVEFFGISSFWDTIKTFFRKREGIKRPFIILLLLAMFLRLFIWVGSSKISFLYTIRRFGWTATPYSTYSTAEGLIAIGGTVLITVVGMKILKVPDTVLGTVSAISAVGGSLIWAGATKPYMMYVGVVVQMFSGLTTIVIRSMISKLVPQSELGKVFSFIACVEATTPLFSGSLFLSLYAATEEALPGAVYLVCAGLNAVIVALFMLFHCAMRDELEPLHVQLENEDSEEE